MNPAGNWHKPEQRVVLETNHRVNRDLKRISDLSFLRASLSLNELFRLLVIVFQVDDVNPVPSRVDGGSRRDES